MDFDETGSGRVHNEKPVIAPKHFQTLVVDRQGQARKGPSFDTLDEANTSAELILQTDPKADEVHIAEFHSTFVKEFRAVKIR